MHSFAFLVRSIVDEITYKPGWSLLVGHDVGRIYLQALVKVDSDLTMDPTGRSKERTPWQSGKRYLSPHMCRQEIVGVVFSLIMAAEEHEVREWFRYKGAAIYNAHLDPDALVELAKKRSSFNVRADAMSVSEPRDTPGWFAPP